MKNKSAKLNGQETIGEWNCYLVDGQLRRKHVSRAQIDEFVTVAGKPAEFALRMQRLNAGLPEFREPH